MISSLELFCGAGGLALGLGEAGFSHCALIEWDKDACDTIRSNIKNGFQPVKEWKIVQTDVRRIDFGREYQGVSVISGGPPCQPFSLGGKHKAYNDERDMFPQAVRAVRELRPKAFVFENVKGLLRQSFSSYFNYILLQLQHPFDEKPEGMRWDEHLRMLEEIHTSIDGDPDYRVIFRLLNAADFGVPQVRQRVVIVGFRRDVHAGWSFPEPTHSKEALIYDKWVSGAYWNRHGLPQPETPERLRKMIEKLRQSPPESLPWVTVRDAICDLPDPERFGSDGESMVFNHEFRKGARMYAGHSGSSLDEPSKTIKAGAHGVPGGENMVVLDDGRIRYYTVRESARIQTFPDGYRFNGSWTESMRQIGNAVPVKLARIIGDSIYHFLEEKGGGEGVA